jgi:membrane dipeptidase
MATQSDGVTAARAEQARELLSRATVCDMTVPWFGVSGDLSRQEALPGRMKAAGYDFISLTIGEDSTDSELAMRQTAATRRYIQERADRLLLVESWEDIERAKREGRLAVGLHFQGSMPVGRDLELVEAYYALGLRHMLMAYNERNFVADGCHEAADAGLSRLGFQLIKEMNRVGMIVDVAHTGHRSSLEAIEASEQTVIVSHGNIWAINEHPRCYRDDQLKALARQDGVIGITGLGIFLGDNEATPERFVRCIRHVSDLVGPAHVGIGSDYVFDMEAASALARTSPGTWPASGGYTLPRINQLEPEQLVEIVATLLADGFTENDILDILGRNWLRVMRKVWR